MIKGIIFDFDGTLFYSDHLGKKVLAEICEERNIECGSLTWESLPGFNREDRIRKLFPEQAKELIPAFNVKYSKLFSSRMKELGNSTKAIPKLAQKYKLFIFSTKYVDLITSGLETKKLRKYFEEIIGYETLENKKPRPQGIFKIMKNYNFSNKEVVLVGDSPLDKEACKRASIQFILFNSPHSEGPVENKLVFSDHLKLESILEKL